LWQIIQKFVREPLADYPLEKNPIAGMIVKVDRIGREKLKMPEG
jgi:hypothetical protein